MKTDAFDNMHKHFIEENRFHFSPPPPNSRHFNMFHLILTCSHTFEYFLL